MFNNIIDFKTNKTAASLNGSDVATKNVCPHKIISSASPLVSGRK